MTLHYRGLIMISLSHTIKGSTESVADYYLEEEKDLSLSDESLQKTIDNTGVTNYYLEQSKEKAAQSFWFGNLSIQSGIENNEVEKTSFEKMLNGVLDDAAVQGANKSNRRQGYDLTFSAPKGASIAALTYGDSRVTKAFEQSIKEVLSEIEKDTAQSRKYDKDTKSSSFEDTGSLLFAVVKHQTSRDNDPNLHYHAIMANMTRTEDGRLTNLATSFHNSALETNGTYERILKNQKYYTAILHSKFGEKLNTLGYSIKSVGKGLIDIDGIPEDVLNANSNRSQEIKEYVNELGQTSSRSKDIAALKTRKGKEHEEYSTLNEKWRTRDKKLGFDGFQFVKSSFENTAASKTVNGEATDLSGPEKVALEKSLEHLADKVSKFNVEKLISLAMSEFNGGQPLSIGNVKKNVDAMINQGQLLTVDKKQKLYTSQLATDKEMQLINATTSRNKTAVANPKQTLFEQMKLPAENAKTIKDLLESKKSVNVIDNINSPSQVSEALLHIAENSGLNVHFLAPDSVIAQQHSAEVSRKSFGLVQWFKNLNRKDSINTVNQFLGADAIARKGKNLIVVEYANALSVKAATDLILKANENRDKLVFINQRNSKKNFIGTDAIDILKKGNITSTEWNNSSVVNTNVKISQVDDKERHQTIATDYVRQTPYERDKTTIVASSKREMAVLNDTVRHSLKKTGLLGLTENRIVTHQAVYLSDQQKSEAKNYRKNFVLVDFSASKPKTYTVVDRDIQSNKVTLISSDKESRLTADEIAKRNMAIFEHKELAVAKGDRLIANSKVWSTDIAANTQLKVKDFDSNEIQLQELSSNKTHSIQWSALAGAQLDYGYALTANKIPFNHGDLLVSQKAYQSSKEGLEHILERAPQSVKFYTDDDQKLLKNLNQSRVQPSSIQQLMVHTRQVEKFQNNSTPERISHDVTLALKQIVNEQNQSTLEKSVHHAISLLSERNAAFSHRDAVVEALDHSIKQFGIASNEKDVAAILGDLAESGELLSAEYTDDTRWVTKKALTQEQNILSRIEAGKNIMTPLVSERYAKAKLSTSDLREGQQDAVFLIATTSDKYVGVQGFAGTGKSTMLETGIDMVEDLSKVLSIPQTTFIGLAPTHAAVAELQEKGVESQTLQKVLYEHSRDGVNHKFDNAVFLLDESSMTSNEQLDDFTQMLNDLPNARAVWLGDVKQIQSIKAGMPFQLAIERGVMDTAFMLDIVRQKNPETLQAVQHLIDRNTHDAIDALQAQKPLENDAYRLLGTNESESTAKPSVIEQDNFYESAAEEYLSRTKETRDNTVFILYSNRERDYVTTELLRPTLHELGELKGDDQETLRLRSLQSEETRLNAISTYENGLIYSDGNTYYEIVDVNKDARSITLKDSDNGDTRIMFPEYTDQKYAQLWKQERMPVAIGEQIVWRVTDKELEITGNEQFTVTDIDESGLMSIESLSDPEKKLTLNTNLNKNQHWDFAYTKTANLAQGSTYQSSISAINPNMPLTDLRRAYIDISRAAEHAMLFTNSVQSLERAWLTHNNDQVSALNVLEHVTPKAERYFSNNPLDDERYQTNGTLDFGKMANVVGDELSKFTESLVRNELGQENKSQSNQDYLVYGRKSEPQLRVTLTGEYRGYFRNFATGERGNMVNFLMVQKDLAYKEALELGANMIASPDDYNLIENTDHQALKNTLPKMQANLLAYAIKYGEESVPLDGTIAEVYIDQIGGNVHTLNQSSLRFHDSVYSSESKNTHPALIGRFENGEGALTGIEIHYLNSDGSKNLDLEVNPRLLGMKSHATINVATGENGNVITGSTDLAIALSNDITDFNISSVNTNTDLRNLGHQELLSSNILLDATQSDISVEFIQELKGQIGHNNRVIVFDGRNYVEVLESIKAYDELAAHQELAENDTLPDISNAASSNTRYSEALDEETEMPVDKPVNEREFELVEEEVDTDFDKLKDSELNDIEDKDIDEMDNELDRSIVDDFEL